MSLGVAAGADGENDTLAPPLAAPFFVNSSRMNGGGGGGGRMMLMVPPYSLTVSVGQPLRDEWWDIFAQVQPLTTGFVSRKCWPLIVIGSLWMELVRYFNKSILGPKNRQRFPAVMLFGVSLSRPSPSGRDEQRPKTRPPNLTTTSTNFSSGTQQIP